MVDPVRQALRISWISIGWSALSGIASISVGISAASLALIGSGASVLIDLSSSAVLVWRFRHPHGHSAAERRAHVVAAWALTGLALLIAAASIARLASGAEAHPDPAAIATASASLLVLPLIAARKYVVAREVPSRALRADAHITVVGASTALVTLGGLALTKAGITNADSIAALVVAAIAAMVGGNELLQLRRHHPPA